MPVARLFPFFVKEELRTFLSVHFIRLFVPCHFLAECHSPSSGESMKGFLFILLFGEKNEPRRTAAPYRAFSLARRRLARGLRNSLRSHSPRPLSALGCRPPGPIRAVSLFSLFVCLCLFPFCSLLTSLDSRSTGNPRRWLCFVMTGGILGGCTSQWAKIYSTPNRFNASLAKPSPRSAAIRYQLTACA